MRTPFPPLSGRSDSGILTQLCGSSERIGLLLAAATVVWLVGTLLFISGGTDHALSSNQLPLHSHHSHRKDLLPPAAPDHAGGLNSDGVAAGGGDLAVETPSALGRGFGFSKLANLQREISSEIHQFLHHDTHFEGEDDDPEEPQEPVLTVTEVPSSVAVPVPVPAVATAASAVGDDDDNFVGFVNPAIVILTYSRRAYLLRTLDSLVIAPGVEKFTLYVSQDAGPSVPDLSDLPLKYSGSDLHLMRHPRTPLLSQDQGATAYLAQHYKWVLDRLFLSREFGRRHSHVVIMEDDMLVSPDFLTLFAETAPLLDTDPTLLCVSSWNDNGMTKLVADSRRLMRTDYFPGLGWMTNRRVWAELSQNFPLDQWDHHMRLDTVHKGRDCLIPEVARNHNIGQEGTNMGDHFYQRYLAPIAFAQGLPVSFLRPELDGTGEVRASGMEFMRGEAYERALEERIARATLIGRASDGAVLLRLKDAMNTPPRLPSTDPPTSPDEAEWLVLYERKDYPAIAAALGLLNVPRAAHRGVSSVRLGAHLVYLADVKKATRYIPAAEAFQRDPSLRAVVAQQNEPCTEACAREQSDTTSADGDTATGTVVRSMRCSQSHFQFINECSVLLAHAPPNACSRGCRGGVSGLDIPNYVDNPTKPDLFGFCLTTEDEPTCDAKHWSASRLCPCVDGAD